MTTGLTKVFTILLLLSWVLGHAQSPRDNGIPDPFRSYNQISSFEQKERLFFSSRDRYVKTSPFDWLAVIRNEQEEVGQTGNQKAMKSLRLMEAQLYHDIGSFDRSINTAKKLKSTLDSTDINTKERVLNIMDLGYGKLKMYDQQIAVRQELQESGYANNVVFYDIYEDMGLYQKAMNQYIQTVGVTIPDNDHYALAKHHNKVGNYLLNDKKPETAINEFNKAEGFLTVYENDISITKSENDIFKSEALLAQIEGNIGKCLLQLKRYPESIERLTRSVDVLESSLEPGLKDEIIDKSYCLADGLLRLGHDDDALLLLQTNFGNLNTAQQIQRNKLLGNYYDGKESYENASHYYWRNQQILDSLRNGERSIIKQQLVATVGESDSDNYRKLVEEQKRAIEKTRSEIQAKDDRINLVIISLVFTLLAFAGLVYAYVKSIKNQQLIAEQKHFIESSLREKDSLLKEIHHRVKNNLQMVSSLLSLQTRNTKSKAAITALEEGKSRVKAMALIHQKLYQNDDLSVIEMQGYIESLITSIQSVYKKGGHNININVDAEGTELDIDRAIPFGLILNEMVSNTFKYAFPDGNDAHGRIYIQLHKNGDNGYFEYTDNGVGLPADTDERTSNSMGLRLINRLVNQLQSKLNVDRNANGVRFWFDFK